MKILCLSDLHLEPINNHPGTNLKKILWIHDLINKHNPNVVIVSGDIAEPGNKQWNPFRWFNQFGKWRKPIVFCLGNHDFYEKTVEETLIRLKNFYKPDKYNVHCLDICGYYDIDNYRFLGNVLWYDGSIADYINQDLLKFANKSWMDFLIKDFDPKEECLKCQEQIFSNYNKNMKNILVTHCVPDSLINLHKGKGLSLYNAFSGVDNFLNKRKFDLSISGHTHLRTIGKIINDCTCVNVGDAMYKPWDNYLIEI